MGATLTFAVMLTAALAALPGEGALFGAVVADVDTDRDGRISRAEYTSLDAMTDFDAMDTDRDGFATAAELGAWVKVTQPRPRERTRPDTPGFGALTASAVPSAGPPAAARGRGLAGWGLAAAGVIATGGLVAWYRRRAR